jgi:integrase
MRGSTKRRGASWYATWDLEPEDLGADPVTGNRRQRRRQRSKGGFRTRKDAERFVRETVAAVDAGTFIEPSRQPLGDFLEREWLPAVEGRLRPLSIRTYRQAIRVHIVPRIGSTPLQRLSPGTLNGFYRELAEAGLSVASRRIVHSVLRKALGDGMRWGKLQRNPASLADPPAKGRSRAQSWTTSELRRFLEHVRGDRLFALWRVAATTGMRRGELGAVTWRSLDLEGGRLQIDRQLVPTEGGLSFGPPKSSRSRRQVALDPETVAALRAHRETQLLERAVAGDAYKDQDLAFADELGRPIRPAYLSELFVRHRKAAGIPVGSLHTLRHSAATLALTNGVPLHIVAARLGDDPGTVLSVYSHLLPQSDELAADRVAAALAS